MTFALAAGAFALFYAFFFPKPVLNEEQELPLSTEAREHGYQALWRWLEAEKIPVRALRQPYTDLAKFSNAGGSVLITTVPHRIPPRMDEFKALRSWVSRGNTLLVLAALDDTPPWSLGADPSFLATLRRMTELRFLVTGESDARKSGRSGDDLPRGKHLFRALQQALEPEKMLLSAHGTQPLFDGVRSVRAMSELPASHWKAEPEGDAALLDIGERPRATDSELAEPAFWLEAQGDGQILVSAFASVFTNALIGEQDNARLFANLIGWSRGPHGVVIFDDDHQGAVEYYDAKAFFQDSRLHRTLLWIVAAWLLFVLGWQRMRPALDDWKPVDVTAFIGTTGQFFASALEPAAAARRLFENFFNTVRRRLSLPQDGAPVWEWLAQDARARGPELAALRDLYGQAQAGKHVDLVRLQNLLSRLSGNLE